MSLILIHYHELALKGRNRPIFINQLAGNIRVAAKDLGLKEIAKLPGGLLLFLSEREFSLIKACLNKIPGIANFMLVFEVKDLEDLSRRLIQELTGRKFKSFKIATQRGDKVFPRQGWIWKIPT